jgi:glycosyltransferase involved in cell wall biosynthesis
VPGGVSDFSFRLLEQLQKHTPVDAFVDGPPHYRDEVVRAQAPAGVVARPLAALRTVEAATGRYDTVVWTLGNSEYHTGALAGLFQRPGVVLAHEVRLTNLYRFAWWQHPEAVRDGFAETLHRMYDGLLPAALGEGGELSSADADRYNVSMATDAIAASQRFLVTSEFAGHLARLDARPHDRDKVQVVPFAVGAVAGDPWPQRGREDAAPLLVTFGGISALKQTDLLIEAFGLVALHHPSARFVFVGPANEAVRATVAKCAAEAGVSGRVEVTGAVDAATYKEWLSRAWVSIQLRNFTNGESSGAQGDCLAAGVPTVITDIGAARAIPRDAAVHTPQDIDAASLSRALDPLLSDPALRGRLSAGALSYAGKHTYGLAAAALYEVLRSLPRRG